MLQFLQKIYLGYSKMNQCPSTIQFEIYHCKHALRYRCINSSVLTRNHKGNMRWVCFEINASAIKSKYMFQDDSII